MCTCNTTTRLQRSVASKPQRSIVSKLYNPVSNRVENCIEGTDDAGNPICINPDQYGGGSPAWLDWIGENLIAPFWTGYQNQNQPPATNDQPKMNPVLILFAFILVIVVIVALIKKR